MNKKPRSTLTSVAYSCFSSSVCTRSDESVLISRNRIRTDHCFLPGGVQKVFTSASSGPIKWKMAAP